MMIYLICLQIDHLAPHLPSPTCCCDWSCSICLVGQIRPRTHTCMWCNDHADYIGASRAITRLTFYQWPNPRTKTLTNGIIGRTGVVGREFESHVHHEKRCMKKKVSFLMARIWKKIIPDSQKLEPRVCGTRRHVYYPVPFHGGRESYEAYLG